MNAVLPRIRKAHAVLRGTADVPRIGPIRDRLCAEPVHFVAWLVAQTPEGCQLADTLIAIARDAYAEDMEARVKNDG